MGIIYIKLDQAELFYSVEQGTSLTTLLQVAEVTDSVEIQRALRDNAIQASNLSEYTAYVNSLPYPNGGTLTIAPMTGDILDFSNPNWGQSIKHLKLDPNGSNRDFGGMDSTGFPNNAQVIITHYGTSRKINILTGFNFAAPTHRFELATDITLNAGESAIFIWDDTIERWIAADK